MNKISKKIISLVTMAAFVLTLVPAAAFAAAGPIVPEKSSYTVSNNAGLGTSYANTLTVTLNLQNNDADNNATLTNSNVKITVSNAGDATVAGGNSESISSVKTLSEEGVQPGAYNTWFTFRNLPVGSHTVTVEVTPDDTVESPQYTKLFTTTVNGETVAKTDAPQVYVSEAPSVGASKLLTSSTEAELNNKSDVTVDPGDKLNIKFNVLDASNDASELALNQDGNVYIWAVNEQGQFTDAITFGKGDLTTAAADDDGANNSKYVSEVTSKVTAGQYFNAVFNRPGTYYIYAGVGADNIADIESTDPSVALGSIDKLGGCVKVTINPQNYVTKTIALDEFNTQNEGVLESNGSNEYTYTINDGVTPNGIKVYTVNGTAYQADGTAAQYETLNLSCVKSDLKLLDTEVGTDANGKFSFRFTIAEPGSYNIKIAESNGEATTELKVVDQTAAPLTIKTTEQGGTLLAGNDAYYADNAYGLMDDAVQFAITDVYDNEADSAAVLANEEAATTGGDHADYLSVTAPKDSTLKADDLVLAWSEGNVFTLNYVNADATGGPAKDLVPGEYTVTVSLNNGKTATATFNIAKFGSVKDITTELEATAGWPNNNNNAITTIDDEVALGQTITGTAYLVDENGIKVQADEDELNIGINGSNSASVIAKDEQHNPFSFTLANNTAANESLIGTTVTIKVFDETHKKYVEKTLTIVKGYLAETLSFDPTEGPINEDNTVAVSVVDENDKLSKVNGDLYAYIEKQSNADAKVELDIANDTVSNGKGELTLYSDQEGTVDVVVVVKAANGEMYGKTLTYTFGAVDPAAQNTVVMTIGSTDYVVNNDIISGDAAPYVDSNWRTMVPFRVLGETFGATVDWDQDNKTVTYTYGNTTLTMTIGSTTYTVNGEDKTMDTAPVLNGDRTYVPVRFVAEALGYEVTPLQDSTGLTASVVFQK